MKNVQNDWLFRSLINGMDKSMQATLRYMYQRGMMLDEVNRRRELEQMKEEIVQDVLSRISVTVDVKEAIKSIDDLNDRINRLGK